MVFDEMLVPKPKLAQIGLKYKKKLRDLCKFTVWTAFRRFWLVLVGFRLGLLDFWLGYMGFRVGLMGCVLDLIG